MHDDHCCIRDLVAHQGRSHVPQGHQPHAGHMQRGEPWSAVLTGRGQRRTGEGWHKVLHDQGGRPGVREARARQLQVGTIPRALPHALVPSCSSSHSTTSFTRLSRLAQMTMGSRFCAGWKLQLPSSMARVTPLHATPPGLRSASPTAMSWMTVPWCAMLTLPDWMEKHCFSS